MVSAFEVSFMLTAHTRNTGWFNAYGVAAHNTSADIFVHLGDYVRLLSPSR